MQKKLICVESGMPLFSRIGSTYQNKKVMKQSNTYVRDLRG
jgi:hypothetical protein